MNELLLLLAQNALLLVAGTTLLLSVGCGAVVCCKSPVHRQRISELTIAGVLGWMVLALFPLPRLLPDSLLGAKLRADVVEEGPVPGKSFAETATRLVEIPTSDPVFIPNVPELMQDERSARDSEAVDALGSPSYVPSPSEELSRLAVEAHPPKTIKEEYAATASAWQFDLAKLAGLFTGAYLAGASLCLLWILVGHVVLLRIRQSGESPPEWLVKQYRSLAKQSGIAPPQLIVSRMCARPLTWGVLWPVVVLPQSLCRQENKSQLETILLHELGHIAQQDSQGNLLFCVALPLLYAHPLYWWLRRESQLAAELVADDWAAQQTGKETYVEELVALARCTGRSAIPLVGVTGLFSSPSLFYRRMQMLLAREKPLSTKTSLPWRLASLSALAGAVALSASLAGVRPAAGQAEPPAATPAPALTPPVAAPATTPPPVAEPVPAGAVPVRVRFTAPPGATPPAAEPPAAADPAAPDAGPAPAAVPAPPSLPALPGATPPPATEARLAPPRPLDPEEAALLAEIKQLQDRLKALEQKRLPTAPGALPQAGIRAVNVRPGMKTVEFLRVDEQGVRWSEVWSTDDKGQPAKIISKTQHTPKQPQPAGLAIAGDGKTVVKEVVEKDGSRRTVILDAATGKVIAENHTGRAFKTQQDTTDVVPPDSKPGKPVVERRVPGVDYPIPVVGKGPRTVVTTPSATYPYGPVMPQPAGVSNGAQADRQLDLVSLATSYADAVSVLESAEAKMAAISNLGDSKTISQQEVVSAKLALSAAKRKEQLLRSITQVAAESAARDLKSGATTSSAAGEAQTRMDILKQILETRPAANTAAKP